MANQQLSTNTFGVAKWIVSATASDGTHTTIAAALVSASSGDTIFIRPGTYTENLTLKNGVKLCGLDFRGGTGTGTRITGKMIDNGSAVTAVLTNLCFLTNSDNIIALTGSGSGVIFEGCEFGCSNSTGISVAANTSVTLFNCELDLGTTGIAFWTGAGSIYANWSLFGNSGSSVTASNTSGAVLLTEVKITAPISTSSAGAITINNCTIDCSSLNTTALTTAGTGTVSASNSQFAGGTASAISVGSGTTVNLSQVVVGSSNTNAITGAGTVTYADIAFSSTSSIINTTTQTPRYTQLGKWKASGQPAFFAYLATNATNATGDGTSYQLGTSALTEKFDTGDDFNTNGTFTAPVAGVYYFYANGNVGNIGVGHTEMNITLTISGVNYNGTGGNPLACQGLAFADYSQSLSVMVSMAAGDTAVCKIAVTGGAKTITILGSSSPNNWFMGYLVG